ncbi:hypothetical protein FQP81_18095 [Pseudoalteromonas distincta]|uniref:hypothetical protein n=1 Tax=Pseudoalteromonas TaxID=53246 RepID=UPI000C340545|nr:MULTISPECIES: hypothetical protein [Pseudoalteromonas]PKG68679.1 hypothetical protein CXF64_20370 [Pseudoalteromonas sp. GutCa3]TVU70367.1 hypothetical protein FQP81_18095 [Pseudoalteromonas elyakovii]
MSSFYIVSGSYESGSDLFFDFKIVESNSLVEANELFSAYITEKYCNFYPNVGAVSILTISSISKEISERININSSVPFDLIKTLNSLQILQRKETNQDELTKSLFCDLSNFLSALITK